MAEGGNNGSGSPLERLIGLASPVLDLVLAVGDRISRVAEPVDYEYYPIRPPSEREIPERIDPGNDPGNDQADAGDSPRQ